MGAPGGGGGKPRVIVDKHIAGSAAVHVVALCCQRKGGSTLFLSFQRFWPPFLPSSYLAYSAGFAEGAGGFGCTLTQCGSATRFNIVMCASTDVNIESSEQPYVILHPFPFSRTVPLSFRPAQHCEKVLII
jgi:hypothetical protein